MLELLAYLRTNEFKTSLVSGGGVEFMRPRAERVYGIPPEQVVGTSGKRKLEVRDGRPVLVKLAESTTKAVNPSGFRCGSGGAIFALFVHHDDAARELACDRNDKLQKVSVGWDEAVAKKWTVVSMKDEWKTVFPAIQK